ncbi:hypothetical protein DRP43_02675 [candidate division TA06 bacterium]|uniref:Insertion element IS150 protein InsJ-like helix-turn-helix domain-containing protein n=1 Tax=candidate division TA06 bacterium TaxID=2250710 RepID=A0A660SKA5_UNCT6|nr:MAG: hypothetical protein DRP43_02675 [candidate division TA06 bacterium]
MSNKKDEVILEGPKGTFIIKTDDYLSRNIAMLVENECLGTTVTKISKKYNITRSRFYQIKNAYKKDGEEGITEKKRGPKGNSIRTETIINQIIRYKFLDPNTTSEVITQKLRQTGYNISIRSVERTITEYGLQKKTSLFKSGKRIQKGRNTPNKNKD